MRFLPREPSRRAVMATVSVGTLCCQPPHPTVADAPAADATPSHRVHNRSCVGRPGVERLVRLLVRCA